MVTQTPVTPADVLDRPVERTPPQDMAAEACVLGGMLLSKDAIADVVEIVRTVEQDADVVILLHREDYYDKESPRAGEIDLFVAKQRNGPTGKITAIAQLHYSSIVDMAAAST